MAKTIKAIIIDDSAFMRKSLSIMLESDPDIEVIATAKDGEEGYKLVKEKRPDIVTLDIEMPKMDGLTALQLIMKDCPTSVLMVSSLTTEGAEATLKALEYGAVDFIPKELSYVNVNIIKIKDDLIQKIKEIVRQKSLQNSLARLKKLQTKAPAFEMKPKFEKTFTRNSFRAIALGISTGGPMSLQKVLPHVSGKINCPVFIVQHMPPKFTKSLADRLNSLSQVEVKEAENNEVVKNGIVYIAPGGFHMKLKRNLSNDIVIEITEQPNDTLHKPSVDVMMSSVVKIYGKSTLGIIMTGMGKDGLEGIRELKTSGGYSVAQNEDSCVVYGMPKSIVDAGFADIVVPLENIAEVINKAG